MTVPDFPERFPIFPLPNVVLFPDARLPLHIFEPRYRQMTADALAGDRVIGMVLLEPGADPREQKAPVFSVGCAGRIVEAAQLSDGRSSLLLAGERRFRILSEEASDKPYRSAEVELLADPPFDRLEPAGRAQLQAARREMESHVLELARRSAPVRVEALAERMQQLDPVELVHALAFGLDCGFVEKQSLLETPDPVARCQLLLRLIEFHRAESGLPYTPKMIN